MDGKILIGTRGTGYTPGNGTRVISLSGLPDSLNIGQIERVFFVYNDTQKILYYAPDASVSMITVSNTNELTIDASKAVLATTDKIKILVWQADVTTDYSLSQIKTVLQNPGVFRPIVEKFIEEAPTSANTYYYPVSMDQYRDASFQLLLTSGASLTVKAFATWDSTADVPNAGGTPSGSWSDVSSLVLGAASLTGTSILQPIESKVKLSPERFLLQIITTSTTNSFNGFIKKF
jgi:hypothetical protein